MRSQAFALALGLLPCGVALCQDRIFPSDYLPAYPGSFWKYANQQGDTLEDSVSAQYRSFQNKFVPAMATPHWAGLKN